jgi:hypothetical protein
MKDVELLALEAWTIFVLNESDRILRSNAPDQPPGPRMRLAASRDGGLVRERHDVSEATARRIEQLAVEEPPLLGPDSQARHLEEYERLLAAEAPVTHFDAGPILTFPASISYDHAAPLIASGTEQADELLARLDRDGMPRPLADAGLVNTGEFWAPWCIALNDDAIASIAFTVGLRATSAEVGVYTLAVDRGRGLAAAATKGWAELPALAGKILFYSTSWTNVSSLRVARRLDLRMLGGSLSIT